MEENFEDLMDEELSLETNSHPISYQDYGDQFAQLYMEDVMELEDFLPNKDAYEEEGFNTTEDSIDHFSLYENSNADKDAYDEEVLDHTEDLMDHFHLFENSYTDKDAYEEEFFDSKILGSEIGFSFENPFADGFSYENFERFNPEFNLKKAILRNRNFINKLHLTNYLTYINDFLLPYSELNNSSLGDEAFAEALSKWQQENGLEADGILGPKTWQKLRPKLTIPISVVETPAISPSSSDAFEFNKWHASQILNIMNSGLLGTAFNSKKQLEDIVLGKRIFQVNSKNAIIPVLPIISHITEMAKKNKYGNIIIGSFVRKIGANGKCTGHCAGKSIDINYKNGGFNTGGSLEMVINIFDYLMSLPLQYRKRMFFGLPFQGGFFKNRALPKFKSAPVSYLQDPRLREMIPHLGGVFPDNDNHLHIQVDWLR